MSTNRAGISRTTDVPQNGISVPIAEDTRFRATVDMARTANAGRLAGAVVPGIKDYFARTVPL